MNIFFLDTDTKQCAKYHCDKHVVKMILEENARKSSEQCLGKAKCTSLSVRVGFTL